MRPFFDPIGLKESPMKYIKAKNSIKINQGVSLIFSGKKDLPPNSLIKFRGSRLHFPFNPELGKCQNAALTLSQSQGNLLRLFSL